MIHGKDFTWVKVDVSGFCMVKLKSETHPYWKVHKIKSINGYAQSIVAPIGAVIDIRIYSFTGIGKSVFKVCNADWIITPPKPAVFTTNLFRSIEKKILQKWYINILEINQNIKIKQTNLLQSNKLARISIKAQRIINTNKK